MIADNGTQELHVEFISCDDTIKLNYYNKLCLLFFCKAKLSITRLQYRFNAEISARLL